MTRRHFEAFAEEIKSSNRSIEERAAMYHLVVRVGRRFTPAFNAERFAEACGLAGVLS